MPLSSHVLQPRLPLDAPGIYRILQHTIIRSTLSALYSIPVVSRSFPEQSAFTWPRPDEQSDWRPNALPQGKHRGNVRRGADVSLLLRRPST